MSNVPHDAQACVGFD